MIKVENFTIAVKGNKPTILSELTMLISRLQSLVSKEDIMESVNLGLLSEKEVDEKLKEEIKKIKNKCDSDSDFDKKIDSMIRNIIKDMKEI